MFALPLSLSQNVKTKKQQGTGIEGGEGGETKARMKMGSERASRNKWVGEERKKIKPPRRKGKNKGKKKQIPKRENAGEDEKTLVWTSFSLFQPLVSRNPTHGCDDDMMMMMMMMMRSFPSLMPNSNPDECESVRKVCVRVPDSFHAASIPKPSPHPSSDDRSWPGLIPRNMLSC
ncbi:hypothetical protein LX32DRAFT_250601 [Colletotrichum zoysiae]|uniref:Uncharacterized protein n=1 Tax=Colletotrichum zoysiae TaxID=1216348 RepID=A0AAD9H548_9PEZI|nr:hypothetical protein LX32DRAFT_250601 [Colletotrichum zoysiae]